MLNDCNEEQLIPYHAVNPTGRRVLILAPHPDDETFGCGGTLARHVAAGDPVRVVILTDGSRGDFSGRHQAEKYLQIRRQETLQAGKILGIHDLHFWPFKDRQLASEIPKAQAMLLTLLEDYQPERIYVPSVLEFHPDHRATAHLLITHLNHMSDNLEVAFYEINQPLCVNTLVDITQVLKTKKAAIEVYKTQLAEQDYDDYVLALNRFRAQTLPPEVSHAEGFSLWPAGAINRWLSASRRNGTVKDATAPGYTGILERQLPFLEYGYCTPYPGRE
ncbi:MAG: PIG-L family deacetylase [Desulfobacteraceae bacterium]|nr:PIG-L family deacetylase [Desulfobacteraceae bacterium]